MVTRTCICSTLAEFIDQIAHDLAAAEAVATSNWT